MPTINHRTIRRFYEAALRDRNPQAFYDDFSEALRRQEVKPEDFSLRRLFAEFVPAGRELLESWNPRSGGGVQLQEANSAVDLAAFSNITGQVVYHAILAGMQAEELVFSKQVRTIPTAFDGEKIPEIGGLGDSAEIVAEGQPYPTIGVGEDWIETPPTIKRGLIVPVTREAIFFDRTGVLLDRCREVGEVLGLAKEKRIIDAIIDGNSTAHRYKWKGTSYATYQASSPWVNIKSSNPLEDWTNIDGAEQSLAAISDPHTGEPMLSTPKHLIVPRDLLYSARRIVNATEVNVATPGFATSGKPRETRGANPVAGVSILSSQLLSSRMTAASFAAGTWLLGDLRRALAYMENWGITVDQRGDDSDLAFERDIVLRFKASERGAIATLEPRVMCKNTA